MPYLNEFVCCLMCECENDDSKSGTDSSIIYLIGLSGRPQSIHHPNCNQFKRFDPSYCYSRSYKLDSENITNSLTFLTHWQLMKFTRNFDFVRFENNMPSLKLMYAQKVGAIDKQLARVADGTNRRQQLPYTFVE